MSRPLPKPPRCRGILLADGNYSGCSFGWGDCPPFDPPVDCPSCLGSGFEGAVETTLPHRLFGDPGCPGCLVGVIYSSREAKILCPVCAAIIEVVHPGWLQVALDRMEGGKLR